MTSVASAFGVVHKSFLGPAKAGRGVAKPARLLSSSERAAVKNRITSNRQEAKEWGMKPGNSTPLASRGYSPRKPRKVNPGGPAWGSSKTTTVWHKSGAKEAAHTNTKGENLMAGGKATPTSNKGGGQISMFAPKGGNYKGTPSSTIHSHEAAHLKAKRNPVRWRERSQDPFRRGREEGRADFGLARAKPYEGNTEFRRGYEDVQSRMAAAKKKRGQNVSFHSESRSWRSG